MLLMTRLQLRIPPYACATYHTLAPPTILSLHPPYSSATHHTLTPPTLLSLHPPYSHSTHSTLTPPTLLSLHPPYSHSTLSTLNTPTQAVRYCILVCYTSDSFLYIGLRSATSQSFTEQETAQRQNLHVETPKCQEVVGSNPTGSSCWTIVCSDLPRN